MLLLPRRTALAGMAGAAAAATPTTAATAAAARKSGNPPRKVIVGTCMQAFWVPYPGLKQRLAELTVLVDRMAEESARVHGRGLDLAILPETSLTGEAGPDAHKVAVPFAGPVADAFAEAARRHRCYIVVPTYLQEAHQPSQCSNAAILLDRSGQQAGIYRKVHLVVAADGKTMEGGSTPGRQFPVFQCDFGKLGIQICYDMEFDSGWRELARRGAEIIAWPTQSPQTAQPAARAAQLGAYIVSSTWRHNASVFEPTGKITAQIKTPGAVLAQEIDLSYAILPWSSKLRNGKALAQMYGGKVGFRYYEDEDLGLFWSNDPKITIRQMAQELGVREADEELARVSVAYRDAGLPL